MQQSTKVKICGITRLKDIEIINKYDIDYVGFVFTKSKRQVTEEQALKLRNRLRKDIKTVGVFVNSSIEEVNEIINYCRLDIAQLHGDEESEYFEKINTDIWKSISVKEDMDIEYLEKYKSINGVLLDTYVKGQKGGTGKTFNWNIVKGFSKLYNIILAGGLTSENVTEGIKVVSPQVVDVSSRVEENGYKNEDKIKEFVRSVKSEIK